MATREIQERRVRHLNGEGVKKGDYVLYWMQQAQRAEHNHALEYAVQKANELGQPLLVVFGLMDDYPSANARHYAFMLEGLRDVQESLTRRGIKFVVRKGAPDDVARRLGENASMIVSDGAYLRPERVFSSYEVKERAPYLGETRLTVGEPAWKKLDRESVEALVGQEV